MRRFLAGFLTGIGITCALLVALGHLLDVEDPLRPADAIVALSGDTGPRTETAVDLWRHQYAPIIIFAGASQDPTSVASGQLMKREAMSLGVPEAAILVEPSSSTTEENARAPITSGVRPTSSSGSSAPPISPSPTTRRAIPSGIRIRGGCTSRRAR